MTDFFDPDNHISDEEENVFYGCTAASIMLILVIGIVAFIAFLILELINYIYS